MNPGAGERERALPSGTVTFLFTDIEGSTLRWERDRAAMRDAVRRHDAIVREALASHGGYVFKTVGDAFCAAFSQTADALAAALSAQRTLAGADFSAVDGIAVRMAVHAGTCDERDGDYYGPTVNRVARLLAIGHGGQVLVSGVAAELAAGALDANVRLRDLGEHRLKDLSGRERVFALVAPDLRGEFPPLRSLDASHGNLPLAVTSFVGRAAELANVERLVREHRLVTLVGSGGIGKTRVSLRVAANVSATGDAAWFVELAPLASGEYVASTIATALGLELPSGGDPVERLAHLLAARRALVVLDNCEHLVGGCVRVVSALLRGCPRLRFLTSSRQPLGIAGEVVFRLPPLDVPGKAEAAGLGAAEASVFSALALFAERANAADGRFSLTNENVPIVADICRRLDGIALAIELAAPRVKILDPRQLRDRLDERFRVLTGGSRDALPRQQTLRALIDWSYDLLDERERAVFRRLSVFVDGFSIEGATAVGGGDDVDELDLLDLLTSLVDKSLVLVERHPDSVRYRMLESTRAYGREKLLASGEHDAAATRHLRYLHDRFVALREEYERTGRRDDLLETLGRDLEDVRAALDLGLERDAVLGASLLVAPTAGEWSVYGIAVELRNRARDYLALLTSPRHVRLRAHLWTSIAITHAYAGQTTQALEAARESLAAARASDDAPTIAYALQWYVFAATRSQRFDDAAAALRELETFPAAGRGRIGLLAMRAVFLEHTGESERALRVREEIVAEVSRLGDERTKYIAIVNLAQSAYATGDTQRALAELRDVVPKVRRLKSYVLLFEALTDYAAYLASAGDLAEAGRTARATLDELAPTDPASPLVSKAIEIVALVACANDPAQAARLQGYVEAAFARAGFVRQYNERTTYDRLAARLNELLTPEDLRRLRAEGAELTAEAAIRAAHASPAS